MPPALDDTILGESSNSYLAPLSAVEEIIDELRVFTVYDIDFTNWDAASDTAKTLALIEAASRIDQASFAGERVSAFQAREWPRLLTGDHRLDYRVTGQAYPRHIKLAQAAEAIAVLSARVGNDLQDRGVVSESVGAHSVAYDRSLASRRLENVSRAAEEIMRAGGLLRGRIASVHRPRA